MHLFSLCVSASSFANLDKEIRCGFYGEFRRVTHERELEPHTSKVNREVKIKKSIEGANIPL